MLAAVELYLQVGQKFSLLVLLDKVYGKTPECFPARAHTPWTSVTSLLRWRYAIGCRTGLPRELLKFPHVYLSPTMMVHS